MSTDSDLNEVLNGEVDKTVEAPTAEETVAAGTTAETTEPTGEDASPPEENIDVEALTAEVNAFKAKAIDETGKRQDLEQRYTALQNQVASQTNEEADFWTDPDKALSAVTQNFNAELQKMNTNVSVQIMRSLHDDYAEMETVFVDSAQKDPALIAQMNQSANPAKFAYDYGKTQQQMAEFADPDAYRAKIEAEVRTKIEAETKSNIEAEILKANELPGSLSTERAAGTTQIGSTASPDLEKLIGQ